MELQRFGERVAGMREHAWHVRDEWKGDKPETYGRQGNPCDATGQFEQGEDEDGAKYDLGSREISYILNAPVGEIFIISQ